MEFFEVIEKRRTVREFSNKVMDDTTIKTIVDAGLKAPTNDHMRDWHFIVVKDKKVVMRLLDIIPKEISQDDMNTLIKEWNLIDPEQQNCYKNAVPK